MVAGGVADPGRSGLGRDPGGGLVVVAQRLGDDGCWDLQDQLAQRGSPAGQGGDAEIPDDSKIAAIIREGETILPGRFVSEQGEGRNWEPHPSLPGHR